MDSKLKEANKNIAVLVNKLISIMAQQNRAYCPYDGCKYEDGEDYSCNACQNEYWDNAEKEMIDRYTVV